MKKKILALCLVVVLAATAVTGATLAYFTDKTEVVNNTFSVGGIKITLDEAYVKQDVGTNEQKGSMDYIQDENKGNDRTTTNSYEKLFPGQNLFKDPTIHMDDKNEDAYLAAVVTIKADDLSKLKEGSVYNFYNVISGGVTYAGDASSETVDTSKFDSGILGAWEFVDETDPDNALILTQQYEEKSETVGTGDDAVTTTYDVVTMTYYLTEPRQAGEDVVLFENIHVPEAWNNTDMSKLNGLQISVIAYAAQAEGFDSCVEAMAGTWGSVLSVTGDATGEDVV